MKTSHILYDKSVSYVWKLHFELKLIFRKKSVLTMSDKVLLALVNSNRWKSSTLCLTTSHVKSAPFVRKLAICHMINMFENGQAKSLSKVKTSDIGWHVNCGDYIMFLVDCKSTVGKIYIYTLCISSSHFLHKVIFGKVTFFGKWFSESFLTETDLEDWITFDQEW